MINNTINFSTIPEAVAALQQGQMVLLLDDESREQEGDLIIAAETVTADAINFMVTHGRGLICLSLAKTVADRLQIPLMPVRHKLPYQAAFMVSIEAAAGVSTGVSTHDRAHTIRVAANPASRPEDISMPGHVFPLLARPGGVLERPGHTEGSVDLMRLAGLAPAAVICETMNLNGTMARLPELKAFALQHQLLLVSINDLIDYRLAHEMIIEPVAEATLPLPEHQAFTIHVFQHRYDGTEHVALVSKNFDPNKPCPVRVHSECLTGDVFGSQRCDCGWQLQYALNYLNRENGILLYLRQEGRGIGLGNKIKAYSLQDQGMDTVEANQHLGFKADLRQYSIAAQILRYFKVDAIQLMTNNPKKMHELERFGVKVVERIPVQMDPTDDNRHYLMTKRDKLGHLLCIQDTGQRRA